MEDTQSPRDILNQALSFQATAGVHEEYARGHTGSTFWKTGFGQCGLVFTVPDQPGVVIKVARPFFGDALQNDYHVHQRIADIFARRDCLDYNSAVNTESPAKIRLQILQVFSFLSYKAAAVGKKPDFAHFTDPEPDSDTTSIVADRDSYLW